MMNKQEFIDQLAKRTNMSKKDAQKVLDATLDLIVDQVSRQDKVTFTGFGTFEARKQKATERINPQTGEKMRVPAKPMAKFRPGRKFKDRIARG